MQYYINTIEQTVDSEGEYSEYKTSFLPLPAFCLANQLS